MRQCARWHGHHRLRGSGAPAESYFRKGLEGPPKFRDLLPLLIVRVPVVLAAVARRVGGPGNASRIGVEGIFEHFCGGTTRGGESETLNFDVLTGIQPLNDSGD